MSDRPTKKLRPDQTQASTPPRQYSSHADPPTCPRLAKKSRSPSTRTASTDPAGIELEEAVDPARLFPSLLTSSSWNSTGITPSKHHDGTSPSHAGMPPAQDESNMWCQQAAQWQHQAASFFHQLDQRPLYVAPK